MSGVLVEQRDSARRWLLSVTVDGQEVGVTHDAAEAEALAAELREHPEAARDLRDAAAADDGADREIITP